jgi:hypothetical protein
MDEHKLLDTLQLIVDTLDAIVGELDANLGPQSVDTIKAPIARTHEMIAELRAEL